MRSPPSRRSFLPLPRAPFDRSVLNDCLNPHLNTLFLHVPLRTFMRGKSTSSTLRVPSVLSNQLRHSHTGTLGGTPKPENIRRFLILSSNGCHTELGFVFLLVRSCPCMLCLITTNSLSASTANSHLLMVLERPVPNQIKSNRRVI